jgi:plasmid stabilization system protein ParE
VKVTFRRFAQYEFDEAADWYNGERIGLGEEFIAEIEAMVAKVSANPYLYQKVLGSVRRAVAPRFPYSVYYKVRKSEIVVLAVFAGA